MTTAAPTYVCRFCRQPSDPSGVTCPNCGAPIDVREATTDSGWHQQPPIRDMARIQFGSSSAQIEGTQVPVVDLRLQPPGSVYFSHHTLLWAEPSVTLEAMPMAGGWSRTLAGLPLVMMQASGRGHLALSEDAPGEVVAVPLPAGQGIHVAEHRFLAATDAVHYTWSPVNLWYQTGSGDDREVHYPMGQFQDLFQASGQPGLLLLHSPGNSFVRDLAAGEQILIQPRALLYKDLSVRMNLHIEYTRTAGIDFLRNWVQRHVWLNLIGPGRVAMQSVFEQLEMEGGWITGGTYTEQHW